jgi:hypothetical protein
MILRINTNYIPKSLLQGVYHLCKKDNETEEEARAQQRAVEPLIQE